MHKRLLLIPLLALASPAAAQPAGHVELIGRAGLGLLRFGGDGATSASFVHYTVDNGTPRGYTNSPYGSRLGAGYALGVRLLQVGPRQGLFVFDLGYERVRSRTSIGSLAYADRVSYADYAADGHTSLWTQNLTVFLGGGHRFQVAGLRLDALVGPELVRILGVRERGSGTYDRTTAWAIDYDRGSDLPLDARLRADATVWYRRVGLNASYSHGFINYQGGLKGGSREAYARVVRVGLAYRLK